MVGQTVSNYKILEKLGEGGMGVVFKAEDLSLRRIVALKFLSQQALGNPEERARLLREAQAAAALDHPSICPVHGIHEHEGTIFLAMAFIDGPSLAEKIKERPLPLDEALDIATQIAQALQEAHQRGIVHRDIKPSNVMLTSKGQVKIMDFGLAQVAGHTRLTKSGMILGTPAYMSPEQAEGRAADRRCDLWSLGVVLYEMLTTKLPFEAEHERAVLHAILNKEPQPVTALRAGLPLEADRILAKALAKDPADRYQHADDLLVDLKALRGHSGAALRAAAAPAAKTSRSERIAWALAAVLLLAALAPWVFRSEPPAVTAPAHRSSVLPPADVYFSPYDFAISPDGQRLAFVGVAADGREALWVRALNARGAQQINDTWDASLPFWSPDSRRVGFFTTQSLKIADTATNTVQTVCDAPRGRGGSWNEQGTIVFSARPGGPLFSVAARGGSPSPATQVAPQSGRSHRWPAFLPDGRRFFYYQTWGVAAADSPDGIYAGSLDGAEPVLVSSEIIGNVAFANGRLLYIQDGSLMARPFDPGQLRFTAAAVPIADQELDLDVAWGRAAFSASQSGDLVLRSVADSYSELVWFDPNGRRQERIFDIGVRHPRLSQDGRFLVVASDVARNAKPVIGVHDLERGVVTRLTNGGKEEVGIWSPDGHEIAYAFTGSPGRIYKIRSDGAGEAVPLLEGPRLIPNDYSPDGRYLAYMTFEKGPPDVMVLDTVEGASVLIAQGGEAQFSPDGKWLAYTSTPGVFVQPFQRTGARILILANASQPRWSRDGKKLYFVAADRKLMEATIEINGGTLTASAPRVLFQTHIIAARFTLNQYDVTPDASRFLINSLKPEAPLTLVTNWPALLQK